MKKLFLIILGLSTCSSFPVNTTSSTADQVSNVSVSALTTPQIKFDCSLSLADASVKDTIQIFIAQSKKQIFLHFNLPGIENLKLTGRIYRPLDIVSTNGSHSKEMLLLHPQFEQYSAGILKFDVEHVNVPLVGLPTSCFSTMTEDELQNRLFTVVFKDLGLLESGNEKARVCNQHIEEINGYADIYYRCCFPDISGSFVCEKNAPNEWFIILNVALYIMYILVFVFSPILIPEIWFQESKYEKYILKTDKRFVLRTTIKQFNKAKDLKQKHVNKGVSGTSDENTLVEIKSVTINTNKLKPVTTDRLPIGLFYNLFKVVLKFDRTPDDSPESSDHADSCFNSFRECYKLIMHFVVLLLILIPYSIRLILFFALENEDRTSKEQFATSRNLSYPYGIKWNVTYTFQPDHPAFIFCYVTVMFIPFVRQFYKSVISAFDEEIFDHTESEDKCYKKSAQLLLSRIPILKLVYILFVGVFKFTWKQISKPSNSKSSSLAEGSNPPTVDSDRPTVGSDQPTVGSDRPTVGESEDSDPPTVSESEPSASEDARKWALFVPFLFLNILMLIPICSFLILCSEFMIFLIQILLYVFIGLILNTNHIIIYISFAMWVIFYGGVFVKSIRSKYENFCRHVIEHFCCVLNEEINAANIDLLKNARSNDKASGRQTNKINYAFPIKSMTHKMELSLRHDKYEKLCLSSNMPFLYFENDKPFIREDFFMELCNLHCVGAPGAVLENNQKAIINYVQVVIFLALVSIVVLAFGESSGVTGTYQAVVALGGGLIPLLLKKLSSSDNEPIDFGKVFEFKKLSNENIVYRTSWDISYLDLNETSPNDLLPLPNDEIKDEFTFDGNKNDIGNLCNGIYTCPMCQCCTGYSKLNKDGN